MCVGSTETTKVFDFTGDGFFDFDVFEPERYATLQTDPQNDLPIEFTICSSIYYGKMLGDPYICFFSIFRDDNWPWLCVYDGSKLDIKKKYDELGHMTYIYVNEFYELNNPLFKPLTINIWQSLCAAINVESGQITVVR